MILVAGFGAFLDVTDNPSERLARAVDGQRVGGHSVRGIVLPVSYRRAVSATLALVADAELILGIGLARKRDLPLLELVGVNRRDSDLADVDGTAGGLHLVDGPATVVAGLAEPAAAAFGVGTSADAGTYVCNGWLYMVQHAVPKTPVGFLHVPPAGFPTDRLLQGLAALVG